MDTLLALLRTKWGKGIRTLKPDYCPTLKEMMLYVVKELPQAHLSPSALKALNQTLSAQETIFAKGYLDGFVHNRYMTPSEDQLRNFWDLLEPIFEITLREPEE